jgi:lipoate-protein ligase A
VDTLVSLPTNALFLELRAIIDRDSRSAAMNMAIDETLLETATVSTIRFYRWDHPALSFGYFGKFDDVAAYSDRDCVRRWTGGGIVLHENDLTYSLIIPATDQAFAEFSTSIYGKIHSALRDALRLTGKLATVAGIRDPSAGIRDAGYNGHCFANPVRDDVMFEGRKVAGAAQRRTRRGLLQQGSVQLANGRVRPTGGQVDLAQGFEMDFATELSTNLISQNLDESVLARAQTIAREKYETETWLRKR